MNKAFEKILSFVDEQIKIEESIAKSENEGHPITHQYGANCMNVIKKFVHQVAEEYNNGWIPCKEGLPVENIEVDVTIKEIDGSTYTQTSWLQEGQWVVKKSPLKPKVIAWKERPEPYKPEGELKA